VKIFVTILLLLIFKFTFADKVDSLLNVYKSTKSDTAKVNTLNNLSKCYYNINIDSAEMYAKQAFEQSLIIKYKYGEAKSKAYLSDALFYKGEYRKSIDLLEEAINIFDDLNKSDEIINAYITLGQSWKELGNNPKALDNLILALKSAEKFKDDFRIGKSMITIGIILLEQKKFNEALQYSKKALQHFIKSNNIAQIANAYARIGNVFGDIENPNRSKDSVIYYYKKSLELFQSINHQRGIAVIYNNIASVYMDQGDFSQAINYFNKAYEMRLKLGDQNGLAIILNNLGNCNINIKNYNKAISYLNQSLNISLKIHKPDMIIDNYNNLAECYKQQKDFDKAYYYKELYVNLKDSLYSYNNNLQITEMQTKYETEKKEKEIQILNQNKAINSLKVQQQFEKLNNQRNTIYLIIVILLFVIIMLLISLKLYYQKQSANKKLVEQNNEIKQQKEEIVTQRDEIEAQINIVTEQKEKIEKIHEELTSSIRYANLLQEAVLPTNELFKEYFSDYFILYKPCFIVSGDFYWLNKIDDNILICVADCTGHGVPGGFMSMLGTSFLNEIIIKNNIISPEIILNQLREYIIISLKQKGIIGEQKDGMDISLCSINTKTLLLNYSGAYNSVYIINSNSDGMQELTEIKADKMPIAYSQNMKDFTKKEMQLHKNDIIYLFSDGYSDQFGGSKNNKFMYKKFKNILLENINNNMQVQKEILSKIFYDWKGENDQTDDITVIGIKI